MKKTPSKSAKLVNKTQDVPGPVGPMAQDREITFDADFPASIRVTVNNSGKVPLVVTIFARDGTVGIPELQPIAVIPLGAGHNLYYTVTNGIKVLIVCPGNGPKPLYSYTISFGTSRSPERTSTKIVCSRVGNTTTNIFNDYVLTDNVKMKVTVVGGPVKKFSTFIDNGVRATVKQLGSSVALNITGDITPRNMPAANVEFTA